MLSINGMATALTKTLSGQLEIEESQKTIIRYGLEVIIGAIVKNIIIFGLAFVLGLTGHVFVLLMTVGIFRGLSGGAHCTSYSRCVVFSTAVLILLSYLSVHTVQFFNIPILYNFIFLSLPIGLYIILIWVPVDTANKRIKENKRKKYKVLTLLYFLLWVILTSFFLKENMQSFILTSIFGIWIQFFSLIPFGINTIAKIDSILSKLFK